MDDADVRDYFSVFVSFMRSVNIFIFDPRIRMRILNVDLSKNKSRRSRFIVTNVMDSDVVNIDYCIGIRVEYIGCICNEGN